MAVTDRLGTLDCLDSLVSLELLSCSEDRHVPLGLQGVLGSTWARWAPYSFYMSICNYIYIWDLFFVHIHIYIYMSYTLVKQRRNESHFQSDIEKGIQHNTAF